MFRNFLTSRTRSVANNFWSRAIIILDILHTASWAAQSVCFSNPFWIRRKKPHDLILRATALQGLALLQDALCCMHFILKAGLCFCHFHSIKRNVHGLRIKDLVTHACQVHDSKSVLLDLLQQHLPNRNHEMHFIVFGLTFTTHGHEIYHRGEPQKGYWSIGSRDAAANLHQCKYSIRAVKMFAFQTHSQTRSGWTLPNPVQAPW